MKKMNLALFLTLFFSKMAFAAPESITVEIIVFEQANIAASIEQESWPIRPSLPKLDAALDLTAEDNAYTILPKAQWQLNDSEKRLTNSGQYRILLHTAWTQPMLGAKQTAPIHLTAGRNWDSSLPNFSGVKTAWELEGTLKVYNARFIHVDADLALQIPATTQANPDKLETLKYHFLESVNPDSWRPRAKTQLQYFKLNHSERVKLKDVYYFDHPLFGVIVRVS